MGVSMQFDDVIATQDGPWECYDATVTAGDTLRMYRTGFLMLDPDRQRGVDQVTGKQVFDEKKVERWTEELINGTAILGQLSWNFRREETELEYDTSAHKLRVSAGAARIPDSWHRCRAIVRAAESVERGSRFDTSRKFSVRIYHVTADEEKRIFYAMNQEGRPADPTRSKWLNPKLAAERLAADFVRQSPLLQDNVDTVRDRLSKKNPRLAAFGTISRAIEDAWENIDLENKDTFLQHLEYLKTFWSELVAVLPELGKLSLDARKQVRETSLADAAIAIYGYFQVARRISDAGVGFTCLKKLAETVNTDAEQIPFLSRKNPEWLTLGVLVPGEKVLPDGSRTLALRNSRQAREAMIDVMLRRLGLQKPQAHGGAAE